MHTLDILLLFPIGLAALRGFRKGFIIEVSTLIAMVIALIACMKLTYKVTVWLTPLMETSRYIPLFSYLIVFAGVFIAVLWIGKTLEKLVSLAKLGLVDKISGALFSMLKTIFMLGLFFWLCSSIGVLPDSLQKDSFIYRNFLAKVPRAVSFLTDYIPFTKDLLAQIENFFDKIAKT
jgi:membrane protein required for colicin V production